MFCEVVKEFGWLFGCVYVVYLDMYSFVMVVC